MSEAAVDYKVPNPTGIPARWLRFLYRMAQLERGKIYHVTIIVPEKVDSEPRWAIDTGAKLENER